MTDADLDRFGPFVSINDGIPVSWHLKDGLACAVPLPFRTRHGEAVVAWSNQQERNSPAIPYRIWGARLPDSRRIECRMSGGPWQSRWRRRSDDGHGWVPGQVTMTRDAVTFLDQEGPLTARANWKAKPMADDLAASDTFLARLRDDRFARAVQLVLSEAPVIRIATGETMIWPSGQLIGEMIADLRGYGEDACDIWFWDDQPPVAASRDEAITALAETGWRLTQGAEAERIPLFGVTEVIDSAITAAPVSPDAIRLRLVPATDAEIIALAEILWDIPNLRQAFARCGVDGEFTSTEQQVLDEAIDRFRSGERQDRDLLHLWLAEGLCHHLARGAFRGFDDPKISRFLARRKVVRDPVEIRRGGMWWVTADENFLLIKALCEDAETRDVALRTATAPLSDDDARLVAGFLGRTRRRHSLMNVFPLDVAVRLYRLVLTGDIPSLCSLAPFDFRDSGRGWLKR